MTPRYKMIHAAPDKAGFIYAMEINEVNKGPQLVGMQSSSVSCSGICDRLR